MPLKRFWAPALTAFLLLAGPLASARAAAMLLSFSGGGGTPLTVTLAQPVTFTISVAPAFGILFDFENVGNLFHSYPIAVNGNGLEKFVCPATRRG